MKNKLLIIFFDIYFKSEEKVFSQPEVTTPTVPEGTVFYANNNTDGGDGVLFSSYNGPYTNVIDLYVGNLPWV